jgi:hypothetical protein
VTSPMPELAPVIRITCWSIGLSCGGIGHPLVIAPGVTNAGGDGFIARPGRAAASLTNWKANVDQTQPTLTLIDTAPPEVRHAAHDPTPVAQRVAHARA